jgi:hypothetical protein
MTLKKIWDTVSLKRKHLIVHCGELALEEADCEMNGELMNIEYGTDVFFRPAMWLPSLSLSQFVQSKC